MKKLTVFALLLATLLATASCNQNEAVVTTFSTTVETTVNNLIPSTPSNKVNHTVKLNTDLTTKKVLVEATTPKTETYDGYTATTAGKAFEGYANIDFSKYNYLGSGSKLAEMLSDEEDKNYGKYVQSGKIAYYRVNHNKEEEYLMSSYNTVRGIKCLGARME